MSANSLNDILSQPEEHTQASNACLETPPRNSFDWASDKSYVQHENGSLLGDQYNAAFNFLCFDSSDQRVSQHPYFSTERNDFSRSVISPSLASNGYYFGLAHHDLNNLYHQTSLNQYRPNVPGYLANLNYAPNDHSFQQQDASTANTYQINTALGPHFPSLAYLQPSQSFAQITADSGHLDWPIISPSTLNDQTLTWPNISVNNQLDGNLHLSEFSSSTVNAGSIDYPTIQSQEYGSASIDDQLTATKLTKLPLPISNIATASINTDINAGRLKCDHPGCGKTFARSGDLSRHIKKHGTLEYPCLITDCNRKGDRAFYRSDKLRDHQRKIHRMQV